jgi:hypothetical protein
MAYDSYGRLRGNGEQPGYFEPGDTTPDYTRHYPSDNYHPPSSRFDSTSHQRHHSPSINGMTSASERSDSTGHEGVSPEVIAAITEKVKKECMIN